MLVRIAIVSFLACMMDQKVSAYTVYEYKSWPQDVQIAYMQGVVDGLTAAGKSDFVDRAVGTMLRGQVREIVMRYISDDPGSWNKEIIEYLIIVFADLGRKNSVQH